MMLVARKSSVPPVVFFFHSSILYVYAILVSVLTLDILLIVLKFIVIHCEIC